MSPDTEMNYEVHDPLLAPKYGDPIMKGSLLAGKSVSESFTYLVPAIPANTVAWELENLAWVNAWDNQMSTSAIPEKRKAYDEAKVSVDILHPMIDVEKEVDVKCAAKGDTITFTITVSNPSKETWMNYVVHDPLLAATYGDPLSKFGGRLAPLGSEAQSFDYLVPEIAADPILWELVNKVTVNAWDDQWITMPANEKVNHEASDSDEVSVDILHPMIGVDKT